MPGDTSGRGARRAWSASRPGTSRPGTSSSYESSETSANAEDVFERLAPLLLLRTLPLEAWDDDHLFSVDESPSVPDVLLDIALAGAARATTRCAGSPPSCTAERTRTPRPSRAAKARRGGRRRRLGRARACMFSLCSSLAFRGIDACPSHSSTASPAATRAVCARVLGEFGFGIRTSRRRREWARRRRSRRWFAPSSRTPTSIVPTSTPTGTATTFRLGDEPRGGRSEGGLLEPAGRALAR